MEIGNFKIISRQSKIQVILFILQTLREQAINNQTAELYQTEIRKVKSDLEMKQQELRKFEQQLIEKDSIINSLNINLADFANLKATNIQQTNKIAQQTDKIAQIENANIELLQEINDLKTNLATNEQHILSFREQIRASKKREEELEINYENQKREFILSLEKEKKDYLSKIYEENTQFTAKIQEENVKLQEALMKERQFCEKQKQFYEEKLNSVQDELNKSQIMIRQNTMEFQKQLNTRQVQISPERKEFYSSNENISSQSQYNSQQQPYLESDNPYLRKRDQQSILIQSRINDQQGVQQDLQQVEVMKIQIVKQQEQIEFLKGKLESQQIQLEKLYSENRTIRFEAHNQKQMKDEIERSINVYKIRLQSLEQQLEHKQNDMMAEIEKRFSQQQEDSVQLRILSQSKLQEQIARLLDENLQISNQNNYLQSQISQMQTKIEEQENDIMTLISEIRKYQNMRFSVSEKNQIRDEIISLQDENEYLKSQIILMQQSYQQQSSKTSYQKQPEVDRLSSKENEANKLLIIALKEQIEELKLIVEEKTKEKEQLQQNQLIVQSRNLSNTKDLYVSEINKMNDQLSYQNDELTVMTQYTKDLEDQISKMKRIYSQSNSNTDLKAMIMDLEGEIKKIKSEKAQQAIENANISRQNEALRVQNMMLQKKLQEIEGVKNESRIFEEDNISQSSKQFEKIQISSRT